MKRELKRELPFSIRDNWFSDIYPTFSDYIGNWYGTVSYRLYGHLLGRFVIELTAPLFRIARVLEIFCYRRKQLDYWK